MSEKLQLTENSSNNSDLPFSNEKIEVLNFVLSTDDCENQIESLIKGTYNLAGTPAIRHPFLDEVFHPPAY